MRNKYLRFLLLKVIFPGTLLLTVAVRPFGMSLAYLLLFILTPPLPCSKTGSNQTLLKFTTILSNCFLLVHMIWHVVLASFMPYGSLLDTYPIIRQVGHNLGLVSYKELGPLKAIIYVAPEIILVIASSTLFVLLKKQHDYKAKKFQTHPFLTSAGKYIVLFFVMFSGVLTPSVTSGVYFLVFLIVGTYWALDKSLGKFFAVMGRILMPIMALHTIILIVYQVTWIRDFLTPDSRFARYFGLTKLVYINVSNPEITWYEGTEDSPARPWEIYASPIIVMFTYYILGLETAELFKPKPKLSVSGLEGGTKGNGSLVRGVSFLKTRDKWASAANKVAIPYISSKVLRGSRRESTPLMRHPSVSKSKWASIRSTQQMSTGSIIMDRESNASKKQTIADEIGAAIIDFFKIMIRSSYIATTIIMMAWSILYHSWLTFVLLMWANIVWLTPNQRSTMLKSSPLLVIYAMVLLIIQYIYGMNLTKDELPDESPIQSINFKQIGISRPAGPPCVPLLIKSLFTCMFWITLRQWMQERRAKKQAVVLTDLGGPLQVTVSTAASALEGRQEDKSWLFRNLGGCLRWMCARYWIYVVAIMLFVIGITGERMTIFRIIYMFLFLVFILMFQISWHLWRQLMYVFWIVVIIYSMLNLILIYVYQFDKFADLIQTFLFVDKKLQHDLGLDRYEPADLFVKLLTPTCFLIITIIQVHYFHKDFMALSADREDAQSRVTSKDMASHRASQGASTTKDEIPPLPLEGEKPDSLSAEQSSLASENEQPESLGSPSLKQASRYSRSHITRTSTRRSISFYEWTQQKAILLRVHIMQAIDLVIMYLELHILKIIFVSLMLLCTLDVCAMHIPIMTVICVVLVMKSRNQRFWVLIISTLISIYFMCKMVYQIDYINHSNFDVNCSSKENNAEWVGFEKAKYQTSLAAYLKGYIGLIAIFTLHSLIIYRQQNRRRMSNIPETKEKLMFPYITRQDADKDFLKCVKYLMNYGFYKFGVEVTLICMIGVIGSRMDLYAVIYAIWLLVLVTMNRRQLARIWHVFTAFLILIIPMQYCLAVGSIPHFCIEYPWSDSSTQTKHIRSFVFLPYGPEPPHATKLIFDYFLLLFTSLQLKVFYKEHMYGEFYPGGSNSETIGQHWETPNFVNPIPDFTGFVGTWLDVVKRMIFLGMLWVTLAIMFMTGTNRVNLFSMGYLIGSFIFLWQGTDFYLLPKQYILRWWSWLLRYNVTVVVIKTLLQIPGCIFGPFLQLHACWLVQLLGIGCVDKFAGGSLSRFIKMDYRKVDTLAKPSVFKKEDVCSVPQEDIGLAWDGVCFAFLILQKRLFHSYYFYRVIDESKATTLLASRGAELIEHLRQRQMRMQEEQENDILKKIKIKMEKIKANQRRIQGISKEPDTHEDGRDSGVRRRRVITTKQEERRRDCPPYRSPKSHQEALHSGDYYMFEDFDDTEEEAEEEKKERLEEDAEAPVGMGLGTLVSTIIKTDLKQALILRRASMPSVRQRRPSMQFSVSQPHSVHEASARTPLRSEPLEREVRPQSAGGGPPGGGPPGGPPGGGPPGRAPPGEGALSAPGSTIEEEGPVNETWFDKIQQMADTVCAFVTSFIISITRQLMKHSRDYRYVSRTLTMEKKILKEREGFGIGIREGTHMRWEPLPEALGAPRKLSDISVPEIRILAPSMERGLDASPAPSRRASPPPSPSPTPTPEADGDDTSEHESAFTLQSTESKDVSLLAEQDDSMFKRQRLPIVHLVYALWYTILAHTDIVCYLMVFINQIQSATILSIPLPLMVFLWGTLTIPRPTKTFWVTLIAYTEVIVLIKSMFQFEILPWNQKAIPANMPFTAPRIIGIERKSDYATYDLLLLLIIFLHRFMLKSLGLWKESTPEVELREDMKFQLTSEDTSDLVDGKGEQVGRKYVKIHNETGPAQDATSSRQPSGEDNEDDERAPGPSKPPDDEYYNVNDDQEPIIAVTTMLEDRYSHCPKLIWLSLKRYMRPPQQFFKHMLEPMARVTADIYAYMFLCDFTNFLVVIFGFAAFGTHQGDGGVQAYLEENKVPVPFLIMLILQFALIVIDRALYLRKFMLGKILFQYALIIGVHVWMFFVLPFITERTFNTLLPPPLWYMMKCIYLLLSAYQIRCGYPRRIIGNFLCKSYRFLNMVAFRGFMAVPFVFELRTLMDWIWTDTSMNLMDWLKMEDIFASVFLLKCGRCVDTEYPQERGDKKSNMVKYLLGGSVLAFVIAIIWFPLVFFAFGNTVGQPNPPTDVTVKIRIGPFLPVYQMSAQAHNIYVFSEQDYSQLSNMYARDRTAQTFLSNYMYNDLAVVSLNSNSHMKWIISPPEQDRLELEAKSNATLKVRFTFVITHPSNNAQNPPTIEDSREVDLPAIVDGARNPERDILYDMLVDNNYGNETWLTVPILFPKFLKVFNKGTAKPAFQLTPTENPDSDGSWGVGPERYYRSVQLRLERVSGVMYWRVRELCSPNDALTAIPMNNCDMLVMYTFNDKLFPETLNFISGGGIIGLYTTFVFLASRVIRSFFSGIYTKIMFDDLPHVDRVLQLCLDIYLVREALELSLEEDLFAKLVFLYRSPETMIKWTRPNHEPDQREAEQRALPPSR